jgi:segregation and condensation protein B
MTEDQSIITEDQSIITKNQSIIEALLFASDQPLSVKTLRFLMGDIEPSQIREAIDDLRQRYDQYEHSFQIVEIAGGYQMCTRPEYAKWVKGLYRNRSQGRLSKAALETLAIIAYRQPIIRTDIESLRGVHIEGVLQTLMERNLITIRGRKDSVGRPLLYGTTDEFLRYFGLNKITDLPDKEELQSLTEGLKTAQGLVTEYESPDQQIPGPACRDLQASGGSIHPGGTDSG